MRNGKILAVVSVLLTALLVLPAAGQTQAVTLRLLASSDTAGAVYSAAADIFNRIHEGRIRLETVKIPLDSLAEKQTLQFISRQPVYDLFAIAETIHVAAHQYLEPLDSYVQRDNVDLEQYGDQVRLSRFRNNLVALPVRTGMRILMYREDLLRAANVPVPRTLEAYLDGAKKLTRRQGDTVELWGTAFAMKNANRAAHTFHLFYTIPGAAILTPDNKGASPQLRSEYAVNQLTLLKRFWDEQVLPNPIGWEFEDSITAMQQGRLAMWVDFSARALLLEDPARSRVAGRIGYTVVPTRRLGPERMALPVSLWSIGIDRNARNKEQAWQFVKFIASFPMQKELAMRHANGPIILKLYDDPEYLKVNPAAPAIKESIRIGSTVQPPAVPQAIQIEKTIQEELHLLILGRKNPRQVAESLFERIDALMK